MKEIVIPKEKAVFRLDGNGKWHNQHGAFEHKKIIHFFHSSIKKDRQGYYLEQVIGEVNEKVYFPYEDTALFVFDVVLQDEVKLVLNTGAHLILDPSKLFILKDSLYYKSLDDKIKFVERGLMKISEVMEEEGEHYYINVNNKNYKIRQEG